MEFLRELIAFLHASVDAEGIPIIPAEILPTDVDREKTYLYNLPAEPDNVFMVRDYATKVPTLTDKQAGVVYVQILVRNRNATQARLGIERIWKFLLNRPEFIEDINDHRWVMIDVRDGVVPLQKDEKGNSLWSLSFPVTTKLY